MIVAKLLSLFLMPSTTTRQGMYCTHTHIRTAHIHVRTLPHSQSSTKAQQCLRDHTTFTQGINCKDLNASISTVLSILPPVQAARCVTGPSQAALT